MCLRFDGVVKGFKAKERVERRGKIQDNGETLSSITLALDFNARIHSLHRENIPFYLQKSESILLERGRACLRMEYDSTPASALKEGKYMYRDPTD